MCVGEGNGWALLGERDKYLAVSPQRVSKLECAEDARAQIRVDLIGADLGEVVELLFLDASCCSGEDLSNSTIVVARVVVKQSGGAQIECTAGKGCTQTR